MSVNLNDQSVLDLIQSRRTCYQFLDKDTYPVKDEKLLKCLQAAIYAPNHKLTQPWRFFVLGNKFTQNLAEVYADNRALKKSANNESLYKELYEKAIIKFMQIPLIVLVGQVINDDPITEQEDYAACSCAIQNFQLMAWQQNIGVQWSTGPIISDKRTYECLDINQSELKLIGALYIGNIDDNCKLNSNAKRRPVEAICRFTE
jgi:nitroreductase